jgi:ABC-type multidrug transport system ATPase subunit
VTAPAAVSVRGERLSHRFGARRTGIDGLEFAFEGPGTVAVTGVNGSGKSTLLRILAGLLPPSAGKTSLHVDGREVPSRERRGVLGLATPDLEFYEEFTARENLVFAGETRGLASPARAAAEALEQVGLSPRADDRVSEFSSGMKQRLRIAFALLNQPPVLLLDEPGSHLDDAGRDVVRAVVVRQASRGLVLLATNDAQEVQLAAARLELRGNGLGDPS